MRDKLFKKRPIEILGKTGKQISRIGLILGPLLFLITISVPVDDLTFEGKVVLGAAIWMAIWWVTEAVPLYVAALLPIVLFPAMQVIPLSDTATNYAHRLVFLLLGGFIIAKAIQKTNLHERFALTTLKIIPNGSPKLIIFAFMIITASISAWMCNTATTLMILPIALAVISQVKKTEDRNLFGSRLMISIAFAASIGGIATLVGTPPNVICSSIADKMFDIDINFSIWMMIGVPVSIISLIIAGLYLTNVGFRMSSTNIIDEKDVIVKKLKALGTITRDQKLVLAVFASTAIAWVSHVAWKPYFPMIDDSVIAIIAAMSFFVLPSKENGRILSKDEGIRIPWGVLLLIGGGLALAAGFTATGVDQWMASQLTFLENFPPFVIVLVLVVVAVIATQFIVNTATAALLIPVAAALSSVLSMDPLLFMIPVAIATSYGFILPVGTPPNIVILGSGYVTPKQLAKVGLPLTLILMAVLTILMITLVPAVF
jgi:solute carrier family 13 (sodium-dependent dicarboxylate transporter), member 2/3/5